MLRPTPAFQDHIARVGLSAKDVIMQAHISRATYFGWLNPATHPHRRGGLRRVNAWKIARVYAQAAHLSEDDAFATLFVEVVVPPA
jgi:hypothetical protein